MMCEYVVVLRMVVFVACVVRRGADDPSRAVTVFSTKNTASCCVASNLVVIRWKPCGFFERWVKKYVYVWRVSSA